MPPTQCPECGRFLKKVLVAGLEQASAPCPGCSVQLTAAMFLLSEDDSVRPPDLAPDEVRDPPAATAPGSVDGDVLAGWDTGVDAAEIASWRKDRRPFPTDTIVIAGAGAAGLLIGMFVRSDRRGSGAVLGLLAGVVGAAVVRRIWRLPH